MRDRCRYTLIRSECCITITSSPAFGTTISIKRSSHPFKMPSGPRSYLYQRTTRPDSTRYPWERSRTLCQITSTQQYLHNKYNKSPRTLPCSASNQTKSQPSAEPCLQYRISPYRITYYVSYTYSARQRPLPCCNTHTPPRTACFQGSRVQSLGPWSILILLNQHRPQHLEHQSASASPST